jgi:Cof subfamily protein (haloacid dehalogenase superfamily)
MYKLIALDIDGTLLDINRAVSAKTQKVLKALSEYTKIVLISSRMPAAMRYLQKDCGIANYPIVAYNGGLVLNNAEVLSHTGIDFRSFKMILDQNQDLGLHLSLFHNDEWFAPQDDVWSQREIRNTRVTPSYKSNFEVYNDWKSQNKEPHKIMCMGEEEKVDKIYNVLSSKSGESLHLYRSKPTYIEMAPKQISKLTGMGVLLDRLYPDIKLEDIIAYGDNYNDMEMLQHVGFGVAVANAKEEVKAIANEITDANIDDGVAKHLQKIFQLKF